MLRPADRRDSESFPTRPCLTKGRVSVDPSSPSREQTCALSPLRALSCLDVARRSRAVFGVALVVGAVMSSAFLRGELSPLALMLSADPLPQITLTRLTAQTTPRASGSIRFPAHHLLVTLDSWAALALGEPRLRTQPAFATPEFPDRPSCPAGSRRRCAPSCWRAPRRQA